MALPNEHQLTFNQYADAQSMFIAIKAHFGGNDLYNNFKIVEQKVKRTVAVNNDDKNLAFLTTSSPSSINSINTANTGVSTGNSKVNTASAETSTASFSDATAYAFLSSQPQGSQLVHEDLEKIHDDDLEEMDLKAVLMKTGLKTIKNAKPLSTVRSVNTARPVSTVRCVNSVRSHNTAHPKPTVSCARPKSKFNYIDARGRFKSVMAWVPKSN
ncbi:hypothetical protein Tco_1528764 [Tanacetum coccineum]